MNAIRGDGQSTAILLIMMWNIKKNNDSYAGPCVTKKTLDEG